MSFQLPDLIIESVIRDGLKSVKDKPEFIENVFESLTLPYNSAKYGESEVEKIKKIIKKEQIRIVHSFHEVHANSPCYSIQLSNEGEDPELTYLDDFEDDQVVPITDKDKLSELVEVTNVIATNYDPLTGIVLIDDSVNLAKVHYNLLFVDADGKEHTILGGIDNTTGQKKFLIAKNADINISSAGEIKSSLDYQQFEVRSVHTKVSLIIGVHSQEALLTKYMYILLKYFLLSRKADLFARNFIKATFQGSDFTRNLQYEGDIVFTRFCTITGTVLDSWRSDEVELFDHLEFDGTPVDC